MRQDHPVDLILRKSRVVERSPCMLNGFLARDSNVVSKSGDSKN